MLITNFIKRSEDYLFSNNKIKEDKKLNINKTQLKFIKHFILIHTTINELVIYPNSYLSHSDFYSKVIRNDEDEKIMNSTRNL